MIKVLVVDDEEDICEFVARVFTGMNLEVKSVLSGENALKLITEEQFNIAVVDLKLSTSVSGLTVIREMREKQPEATVVVLSGYVDVGLAQETRRLGVADFWEKPKDMHLDILEKKIQGLLTKMGN